MDIIEPLLGINEDETTVDFEPFERDGLAVFFREARDVVHDGKNRVCHGDLLKAVFRKADFNFLAKGLVPFLIGATGARQKKAALHEIFSELLAFFLRERKRLVAGHDAEREIEERIGIEAKGAKTGVHPEVRLFADFTEKTVGETNGAFVAGVDQVTALEQGQVRMNGWRGGSGLRKDWRSEKK